MKTIRTGSGLAILMAILCCGTGAATAAEAGFYVAGDLGISSYDVKKSELDGLVVDAFDSIGFEVVDADSDLTRRATGIGLTFGYQFSPHAALEVAYLALGEARYDAEGTVTDGVDDYDAFVDIDLKAVGPAVSLLGIWPVNEKLSLHGRVGAFFSRSTITVKISDGVDSESDSGSERNNNMMFGVGGVWSFSSTSALRLNYTIFKDGFGDSRDVNQFSVGLQYRFGG